MRHPFSAFHGPRVHVLPADLGGQVSIRLLTAMGLWDENDLKHFETTFRKIQTKVDNAMRAHPVGRFFFHLFSPSSLIRGFAREFQLKLER